MKKALVFGATGQMGSYLVEHLTTNLSGYDVVAYGSTDCNFQDGLGTLQRNFQDILEKVKPDEIYNFAARMHAEESWETAMKYLVVNGVAVEALLENIQLICPKAKFFNAGSADMFDKGSVMQYEDTQKKASNPHALSKWLAYEAVRMYREEKGLFCATGIFFNAESPRRAKEFFAQKVASEAARIRRELDQKNGFEPIQLGRLDARRDWGWAPEYVEVAWEMMQRVNPTDLVIGTGETHTTKEFVTEALKAAGLPDVDRKFDEYVKYQKTMGHKQDDTMSARPHKAKLLLGWEAKYKMKDVVRMLVEAEMKVESTVHN